VPPWSSFTPAPILTVAWPLHSRCRRSSSSLGHCWGRLDLRLQARSRSIAAAQAPVSSTSFLVLLPSCLSVILQWQFCLPRSSPVALLSI
jgi:hypothetical protein